MVLESPPAKPWSGDQSARLEHPHRPAPNSKQPLDHERRNGQRARLQQATGLQRCPPMVGAESRWQMQGLIENRIEDRTNLYLLDLSRIEYEWRR